MRESCSFPRGKLTLVLLLLLIPIVVFGGALLFQEKHYAWIALCVALLSCLPLFICFERKGSTAKELTTLADYFVLCTATSTTQVKAMSDACEEAMEKQGETVHHIEGHRDGSWLLMDFSCVIVHVFTDEARKFYDLERLWADAQEVDLSDILVKE